MVAPYNVDKNCSDSLPASEMGSHEAVPVNKKTTTVGFEDVGRDAEEGGLQPADIITIMQELLEGNGLKSFLPLSPKDTLATTVLPAILKVTEAMSKPGSTSTAVTIIDLASALFDALLISGAEELDATATKVSVTHVAGVRGAETREP